MYQNLMLHFSSPTVPINSLHIKSSRISPVILNNGTNQPVVLDCDYDYDHYEASGLTLKWFWYRDHEPVYQWIPGGVPEVRGILKVRPSNSYPTFTNLFLCMLFIALNLWRSSFVYHRAE